MDKVQSSCFLTMTAPCRPSESSGGEDSRMAARILGRDGEVWTKVKCSQLKLFDLFKQPRAPPRTQHATGPQLESGVPAAKMAGQPYSR